MNIVMAVGAHPDDIEFGCGGTIIKHAQCGDIVIYVCMTGTPSVDGVTGKTIRSETQYRVELDASYKILDVDYCYEFKYTDLNVPFNFDSISELNKIIVKHNVNTIYTHWAGDANQDHIATFKATMAAARYVENVFCYEQIPIPRLSENNMDAHYYVGIDDTFKQKISAAMAHRSQIEKYKSIGYDVEENLTTLAKYRGIQANCIYAEAFQVIKKVWR